MPIPSFRELQTFLDLNQSDEAQLGQAFTRHQHGPGQLDKWLAIMEGQADSWRQRKARSLSPDKPKIIFSNTFLQDLLPTEQDIFIISGLVKHFQVLPWLGERTSFSEVPQLNSTGEFWQILPRVQPATAEHIKAGLSRQGIASEGYLFLDYAAYERLLCHYDMHFYESHRFENLLFPDFFTRRSYIDMSKIPLNSHSIERIAQALGHDTLAHLVLDLPTVTQMQHIIRHFPQLPSIALNNSSRHLDPAMYELLEKMDFKLNSMSDEPHISSWHYQKKKSINKAHETTCRCHHTRFAAFPPEKKSTIKQLKLIFDNSEVKLDLKHCTDLDSLLLSAPQHMSSTHVSFDLESCKNLTNLTLHSAFQHSTLDLTPLSKLETLELLELNNLKELKFNSQNLRHLNIAHCRYLNLKSEQLQYLESLTIKIMSINDAWLWPLDFNYLSTLKHLHLIGTPLELYNYIPLKQLETLILEEHSFSVLKLGDGRALKRLVLRYCAALSTLDLSQFPNLEELEIIGAPLTELDLSPCLKLRRLTLKCNSLKEYDVSTLSQLEVVTLHTPCLPPSFAHCTHLQSMDLKHEARSKCAKGLGLPEIDLRENKELLSLNLEITRSPKINLADLTRLRHLRIIALACADIILKNNTALSDLFINVPREHTEIDLTLCKTLDSFLLSVGKFHLKNLQSCSALRSFSLSADDDEPSIELLAALSKQCHFSFTNISHAEAETKSMLDRIFNPSPSVEAEAASIPRLLLPDYNRQRSLHLQNAQNPVSTFTFSGDTTINNKTTAKSDAYISAGNFTLRLNEKRSVARGNYRIQIYDSVQYHRDQLIFSPLVRPHDCKFVSNKQETFDQDNIKTLHQRVQQNPTEGYGYFAGEFIEGTLYPLPTQTTMLPGAIPVIYTKPQNAVALTYHPVHQQFYCMLNPPAKKEKIEIVYFYKRNPLYLSPAKSPPVEAKKDLLPLPLKSILEKEFKGSALDFLFSGISLPEKLHLLIAYFKHFRPAALDRKTSTALETLIACVRQQKGVCRHRAMAFMVLSQLINIPTRMIYNENHAYCEVEYKDGWHQLDLGGAPILDITPIDKRKTPIDDFIPAISKKQKLPQALPLVASKEADAFEEKYFQKMQALMKTNELTSIDHLLNKQTLPILIEMRQTKNITLLRKSLWNVSKQRRDIYANFLYIHSPADIYRYLMPYTLLDNGKREKIEGPLFQIIKKGGLLLINWSTFSATEIASFKSILDPAPTLLGETVSPLVITVGVKKSGTQNCAAFSSRCQTFSLPENFQTALSEPMSIEVEGKEEKCDLPVTRPGSPRLNASQPRDDDLKDTQEEKCLTVDLFHRSDWREYLLGDIVFEGKTRRLIKGPLITAILARQSLLILNPPNDPEFHLLLEQIRDEGRMFFNGRFIPVLPPTQIQLQRKQHASSTPQVKIITDEKVEAGARLIYLGMHNWHEYSEILQILPEEQKTLPGYLKQYEEKTDIFYITDNIPFADWIILIAHIKAHYPAAHFRIKLAPGAHIENVASNMSGGHITELKQPSPPAAPAVFLSNDPYFLAKQLLAEQKHAFIIDINLQTSFQDLILKQSIKQHAGDAAKIEFKNEEKGLLLALKLGYTVILNGELSPSLYQQLLPLFSASPHININGKRFEAPELKGQVLLVMPNSARETLFPLTCFSYQYTSRDYLAAFPADTQLVKTIEQFFGYANRLPHRGAGFPTPPSLTYARLKNMIRTLKESKLHPQNPIKGLLLYDYPKDSEAYAYLNVMGKYLFRPDNTKPLRLEKLKRLALTRENFETKTWHVLNCFSGADLKRLLGNDLTQIFNTGESTPTLKRALTDALWNTVSLKLLQEPIEVKREPVVKRIAQTRTLLEAKQTVAIYIKGAPGVGKTFMIQQLKKVTAFYEGLSAVKAWLEDGCDLSLMSHDSSSRGCEALSRGDPERTGLPRLSASQPRNDDRKVATSKRSHALEDKSSELCILFFDEANFADSDTYNFLQGITRDQKSIFFEDKLYQLSDRHKILATGNPEHYSDRHYLSFFQQHGETLYFKALDDAFIEKTILQARLPGSVTATDRLTLLNTFHLIEKQNPTFVYSTRDIENLVQRILVLIHDRTDSAPLKLKLLKACLTEFAGTLHDLQSRQLFEDCTRTLFNIPFDEKAALPACLMVDEKTQIPREKEYLIQGIEQALKMRESKIDSLYRKLGILIEGDPGLGKSTLFKIILEKRGFRKDHADTQKRYYEISAGDSTAHTVLNKAYHEESVVILDELNLDTSLEVLLNQMNPSAKPGFMVFASQNPCHEPGRKNLSHALRSRFHFMYMNPYSADAKAALAGEQKIPYPLAFVSAFNKLEHATMRTFFTALNSERIEIQRTLAGAMKIS